MCSYYKEPLFLGHLRSSHLWLSQVLRLSMCWKISWLSWNRLSNCWLITSQQLTLLRTPIAYGKLKHIQTRFHYLRDQVNKCKVIVVHCSTNDQIAVVFTKLVKSAQLQKLNRELQVVSFEFESRRGMLKYNWQTLVYVLFVICSS